MNTQNVTLTVKDHEFLSIQIQDLPKVQISLHFLAEIISGIRQKYTDIRNRDAVITVTRNNKEISFSLLYTFEPDLLDDEITGIMRWFSVSMRELEELLKTVCPESYGLHKTEHVDGHRQRWPSFCVTNSTNS